MTDQPEYINNTGDSRRSFIKKGMLASALIAASDIMSFASVPNTINNPAANAAKMPWYRELTRWGQVNISEKDPAHYDIAWWRKYWKRTNIQGIVVNAGGIVAYYPSKVPLHHPAEYLKGGDLFGDLCRAAHEDGIAVFARMDSNRAYEEVYNAHPDWFCVDINGKPIKAGDLYITCVNGPYYNEHIPAILREIYALYKPEGFTDNSWSGLGRETICYCQSCQKSFKAKTGNDIPKAKDWESKVYKQWIRWNYDRRLEIWDLNNKTTKAVGGPDCTWSGMNSGSISGQSKSFRDVKEIYKRADIVMLDDQSRINATGFQHNGINGKLIHGLLGWDKLVPESMAMYQAGRPWFRLAAKPAPEAQMWSINGIAGGIQPWWHILAASHDDRRMYKTFESLFAWHKTNEKYLINRKPIAKVGVVWSQENTDYYGKDDADALVEMPIRGMTQALLKARIPYLMVHADHIERDAAQFSVLVLPNLAVMSDKQVAAIKAFVDRGGSLIASGETSRYTEWGNKRDDYALGDVFGAHIKAGDYTVPKERLAGEAYHTYLRLLPEMRKGVDGPSSGNEPELSGKRHDILKGFDETDIVPFGGLLNPLTLDAGTEVLLTYIPQFPVYPPETAWMRVPKTDIPGLILNTKKQGNRVAFIPADIDKQYGRDNSPDHGNLLANIVKWAAKDDTGLNVEGAGMIDCHLYQQQNRVVLHLVNLSNSGAWRAPIDEYTAIGPFKVRVKLPNGVKGNAINTLVNKQPIQVNVKDGYSYFEIKSILNHEVIILS
jgi:hypothetical protein